MVYNRTVELDATAVLYDTSIQSWTTAVPVRSDARLLQCQYYNTLHYRYYTSITITRVLHYQCYCRLQHYEYSRVTSRPTTQARVHADACASRCSLSLCLRQRYVLVPRTQPSKSRVGPTITRPHPSSTSFLNALRYSFRHLRPPPLPLPPPPPACTHPEQGGGRPRPCEKPAEGGREGSAHFRVRARTFPARLEGLPMRRGTRFHVPQAPRGPGPPNRAASSGCPEKKHRGWCDFCRELDFCDRLKHRGSCGFCGELDSCDRLKPVFVEVGSLRPAKNTEGSPVFVESWIFTTG